jgi:hypothetical protein
MSIALKTAAQHEWHKRVQASIAAPATAPSPEMQRWFDLQLGLARYAKNFHGGLETAYRTSPEAFAAVLKALENGFQAAAGPYTKQPNFRGI